MRKATVRAHALALLLAAAAAPADEPAPRILANHLGFESRARKSVVVAAPDVAALEEIALLDDAGRTAWKGPVRSVGAVDGWKGRFFWAADLGDVRAPGRYRIVVRGRSGTTLSEPFEIREGLLAETLVPDILFYLKARRSSGEVDAFDRHVPFFGGREGTVDVHGGWFDASGDESKYLTHLSYATYMNPQQQSQVVWNLLAARDLAAASKSVRLRSLVWRIEDEARHGADFLVRMQDPEGYFYTTVHDVWTHVPANRTICSFRLQTGERDDRYRAGYRMGAGAAIAALARAAALGGGGELPASRYRKAAVDGFRHLEAHNREYLDDGRENILDDYGALLAATELFRATGEEPFLSAARRRATSLAGRLASDARYRNWWRADDRGARPFWHAVEAGLPVVALLRYVEVEPDAARGAAALRAVSDSLAFELGITAETVNPFGLARQYVSDARGGKRGSFFMPHDNESGYWWQGENARLASLAAAALLAARVVDAPRRDALARYAVDQVDWILGRNPFDVCMLQGRGRNAPDYLPGFPNAPGGICNGITSGFEDERDVAFLPAPRDADPSHNWRWSEQWLPHDAWMLLALAALDRELSSR
ncbi:MAG: glycoside hydrolase family 9 protein [Thermoanaerobaculia bacterium]